ncbi:hypothetical protein M8C21_009780 [Ambrosia artemisiifolia]|uniref:Uncharacterized protein n=1 Tax=Ambrosia artemisiifolia TaxID=4212 RepID=A0AAD5CXT2_AMBAR|nr:hypothetical protein M8C21_009780 [Ambrosia artemisiifolia]
MSGEDSDKKKTITVNYEIANKRDGSLKMALCRPWILQIEQELKKPENAEIK